MKIACFIALLGLGLTASAQNKNTKVHINHTAIYVMNIAATGNFYTNILGLDSIAEPFHDGKHIWYKTSEHTMLHVIQGATQKSVTDFLELHSDYGRYIGDCVNAFVAEQGLDLKIDFIVFLI